MASTLRAAAPLACRTQATRGVLRRASPLSLVSRKRRVLARSGTVVQPGGEEPSRAIAATPPVESAPLNAAPSLADALADSPPGPSGSFDWHRHWYAIAALDALERDVPNAMTILGQRIAVWLDNGLEWRALRDECPHRLAPLSEGRIAEDGTLQARRACFCSRVLPAH